MQFNARNLFKLSLFLRPDCLQLICTEAYTAVQPDEMSIEVDDVVKVTKKTNDGRGRTDVV